MFSSSHRQGAFTPLPSAVKTAAPDGSLYGFGPHFELGTRGHFRMTTNGAVTGIGLSGIAPISNTVLHAGSDELCGTGYSYSTVETAPRDVLYCMPFLGPSAPGGVRIVR